MYYRPVHQLFWTLDERNANLEQVFQIFDLAPIGQEENDMIIRFDNGVVVRNDDLAIAYQRDD